jgi:hypothetical protein
VESRVAEARRRNRAGHRGESFSPRTSKWNKIEHRLFSFLSKNWRGQPLTSLKVIVNLIAGTTTKKGRKVHARIDAASYPGVKVPGSEMAERRSTVLLFTANGTTRFCLESDNIIS